MLNAAVNASVHGVLGETGLGCPTMRQLRLFLRDQTGATAVEYGLIAALLGIAIIGGASLIGQSVNNMFINEEAAEITTGAPAGS